MCVLGTVTRRVLGGTSGPEWREGGLNERASGGDSGPTASRGGADCVDYNVAWIIGL